MREETALTGDQTVKIGRIGVVHCKNFRSVLENEENKSTNNFPSHLSHMGNCMAATVIFKENMYLGGNTTF